MAPPRRSAINPKKSSLCVLFSSLLSSRSRRSRRLGFCAARHSNANFVASNCTSAPRSLSAPPPSPARAPCPPPADEGTKYTVFPDRGSRVEAEGRRGVGSGRRGDSKTRRAAATSCAGTSKVRRMSAGRRARAWLISARHCVMLQQRTSCSTQSATIARKTSSLLSLPHRRPASPAPCPEPLPPPASSCHANGRGPSRRSWKRWTCWKKNSRALVTRKSSAQAEWSATCAATCWLCSDDCRCACSVLAILSRATMPSLAAGYWSRAGVNPSRQSSRWSRAGTERTETAATCCVMELRPVQKRKPYPLRK